MIILREGNRAERTKNQRLITSRRRKGSHWHCFILGDWVGGGGGAHGLRQSPSVQEREREKKWHVLQSPLPPEQVWVGGASLIKAGQWGDGERGNKWKWESVLSPGFVPQFRLRLRLSACTLAARELWWEMHCRGQITTFYTRCSKPGAPV